MITFISSPHLDKALLNIISVLSEFFKNKFLIHKKNKMKVVSSIGSLKNRSKDCQIVRRRGRLYVICKTDPRLKVRQGGAKMKRR